MEQEVAALEDRRFAAMQAADLATLEALFDDALVYTHSSGARDDRTAYLKGIRDGVFRYHAIEVSDRVVRMFGDTALVFAHVVTRLTTRGIDKTIDNVTLSVWVRRPVGWRFVAYQPTLLPK